MGKPNKLYVLVNAFHCDGIYKDCGHRYVYMLWKEMRRRYGKSYLDWIVYYNNERCCVLIFDYDADLDAYIITIDRDGNSIKFVLYVNAKRTVKLLPKVDDPHHRDRLYNISNRYIVYKDRHVTHDRCIAMKIMAVSNKPFKGDLFISRIISEYKHKTAEIYQCEQHINELKIQRAKISAGIRLNKMVKSFVKSFVGEKDHPVNRTTKDKEGL